MDVDPAHVPVLLDEVVGHLAAQAGDRVLDCTCGLGGHSAAILGYGATVLGIDRDPDARDRVAANLAGFGDRFAVRGGSFAHAAGELVAAGETFDGVLADLGVSSLQLDDGDRGFSIRSSAPADMRMGDDCEADVLALIADLPEDELATCLRRLGEEPMARRVARALQTAVAEGRTRACDLADAVRQAVPGHRQRHPAIRSFQALRMAVNDELGELRRLLALLPRLLRPGGRAAIISFHSLEDRMVKRSFRDGRQAGIYADIARKVVLPGDLEIEHNRRAHSARLRWAIRSEQPVQPDEEGVRS